MLVLNSREQKQPTADVNVHSIRKDLIDADVRTLLSTDTTDAAGKANVFMPYENTRYSIEAGAEIGGQRFAGHGIQPSQMKAGMNDQVQIILESAVKKRISVLQKWDIKATNRSDAQLRTPRMRSTISG